MTESRRRETAWRNFAIPAVLALVGYIVLYAVDRRLRSHRGPWEVTFGVETDGTPALEIAEQALDIREVRIRFPGERVTNASPAALPQTIRFDAPQRHVPFGSLAFDDLMYLPGTVVLHCFGHEVQLLPRALFLNRREHPWREAKGKAIELRPGDRLPTLEPPGRKRRRTTDVPSGQVN